MTLGNSTHRNYHDPCRHFSAAVPFNDAGKLERITAPTGEFVTLRYDTENLLVCVAAPQGRSLHLVYFDHQQATARERFGGVQYIDSPVGRFAYEYGSAVPKGAVLFDHRIVLANLVRVHLPTGYDPDKPAHELTSRGSTTSLVSRFYHHENPTLPWLLIGISIETVGADGKITATRYATYGYDNNGHANLSTHAGDVDKVTLDTSEGGRTVLTNSLGQKTTYRHAIIGGEHRMLEVRGAGCSTCGETNVRYGYDKLGQLVETTRLDENGEPVSAERTERDKLGRPVRIGKITFLNGKAQPVVGYCAWNTRAKMPPLPCWPVPAS